MVHYIGVDYDLACPLNLALLALAINNRPYQHTHSNEREKQLDV